MPRTLQAADIAGIRAPAGPAKNESPPVLGAFPIHSVASGLSSPLRDKLQNELTTCFFRSTLKDSRTPACGFALDCLLATPTYSQVSQSLSTVIRM